MPHDLAHRTAAAVAADQERGPEGARSRTADLDLDARVILVEADDGRAPLGIDAQFVCAALEFAFHDRLQHREHVRVIGIEVGEVQCESAEVPGLHLTALR